MTWSSAGDPDQAGWYQAQLSTKKDQGDLPTGRTVLTKYPNCLFLIVDSVSTNVLLKISTYTNMLFISGVEFLCISDPPGPRYKSVVHHHFVVKLFPIFKEDTQAAFGLFYTVKKVNDFPVPSRDVYNQTLPGRE